MLRPDRSRHCRPASCTGLQRDAAHAALGKGEVDDAAHSSSFNPRRTVTTSVVDRFSALRLVQRLAPDVAQIGARRTFSGFSAQAVELK